jgi:SsrA-binding protein
MSKEKIISNNKKAYHDYFIEETFEAGIVLTGTEIKSIRAGKVQLKDSYARITNGEIYWWNGHISHFEHGNRHNHDETRTRKLLLKRQEINKLADKIKLEGYTLIPTKVYLKNGFAKLELGLAKGKKNYDKRETLKKKDAQRQIERSLKER